MRTDVISFLGKPKSELSWNFIFYDDGSIEIECGSIISPNRIILYVEDVEAIISLWEEVKKSEEVGDGN